MMGHAVEPAREPPSSMRVPMVDLRTQYQTLRAAVREAVDRVMESQRFILGPEGEALEREVAALCGAGHGVGTSSGTDALLLALTALGVGPGDEIITTPFTFFATAGSVARLGARPVMVDIDPDTLLMDPAAARAAVTQRTRGFLPVHLFGQLADCAGLGAREGRFVLEDAAQAIGATGPEGAAGAIGDAGAFSFFPSKNLGGAGDGGMVVTGDAELAARMRQLRNHGQGGRALHERLGGNFRLDELQAAVLRAKLPYLERWTRAREAAAARYDELLGRIHEVACPPRRPGYRHVFHQYVIRVPRRDALREHLSRRGIDTAVYYPVPVHLQPCFAALGYHEGSLPNAEAAAREVLALPMSAELRPEQQEYVAEHLRAFFC